MIKVNVAKIINDTMTRKKKKVIIKLTRQYVKEARRHRLSWVYLLLGYIVL